MVKSNMLVSLHEDHMTFPSTEFSAVSSPSFLHPLTNPPEENKGFRLVFLPAYSYITVLIHSTDVFLIPVRFDL